MINQKKIKAVISQVRLERDGIDNITKFEEETQEETSQQSKRGCLILSIRRCQYAKQGLGALIYKGGGDGLVFSCALKQIW